MENDLPLGWLVEAAEAVEKGRLPCTVGPDDPDYLPWFGLQVYIAKRHKTPKDL